MLVGHRSSLCHGDTRSALLVASYAMNVGHMIEAAMFVDQGEYKLLNLNSIQSAARDLTSQAPAP
jgi:hypothetical protein